MGTGISEPAEEHSHDVRLHTFHQDYHFTAIPLILLFLRIQESRGDDLFPFQIEYISDDEDSTTSKPSLVDLASKHVKAKLQGIIPLLNQDISLLVQNAEEVRKIFQDQKGQLPADVADALLPAAFIECHQFKVLRAKQRLADRASQADLLIQKETSLLTQKYHWTDPRANQHRAGEICFAPSYRTQIGVCVVR